MGSSSNGMHSTRGTGRSSRSSLDHSASDRYFATTWASIKTMHWSQELSGSLGDLGTFLPLVVALSATIQLDLGSTLLFSGLYNIWSGVMFRIPMCVQPMKTVAAVALSAPGLSLTEVMSAGLFVGGVMLLLGISGVMQLVSGAVPGSIVRGIQLAVGLTLAQKGATQVFKDAQHQYRALWGVEGCLLGVCAAVVLLITTLPTADAENSQASQAGAVRVQRHTHAVDHRCHYAAVSSMDAYHLQLPQCVQQQPQDARIERDQHASAQDHQQGWEPEEAESEAAGLAGYTSCGSCDSSSSSSRVVPSALLVVLLGLLLSVLSTPSVLRELHFGPSRPRLYLPSWDTFRDGILKAGLAQLPLTSLNSVIAVSHLALQLFPERAASQGWRWRPGPVAISVGLTNLVGCWFGAFPCCHGSGGLAAQFKFGARTGLAPALLGVIKVVLALLFGSSILQLLQHFPQPLLGALLLLSGLELAASARKETDQRGYMFMMLTAAAIMGLKNTAFGFLFGLSAAAVVSFRSWLSRCIQQWHKQQRPADVSQGTPAGVDAGA